MLRRKILLKAGSHGKFCDLRNSDLSRLSRRARYARLGMGTVECSTENKNHSVGPFIDRLRSCDGFCSACRFIGCLCPDSRISVLRSVAPQDFSIGTFAFACRYSLRHRGRVANDFIALARPGLCAWDFCFLDSRCIRRVARQSRIQILQHSPNPLRKLPLRRNQTQH